MMRLIYCHLSELGVARATLDSIGLTLAMDTGEPYMIGGGSSLNKDDDKGGQVKIFSGLIESLEGEAGDLDFTVLTDDGTREEFYSQVPSSLFRVGRRAVVKFADIPFNPEGAMAGKFMRSTIAIYLEA